MVKRKICLYLLVFVLSAAVTAAGACFLRGHKFIARADSIERRIAQDGTIYEIISESSNKLCLRKMTPGGLVTGYYPLPNSPRRGMYTAYHVVGLLEDEIYLYKYDTGGNTPERVNETIVAYDMTNGESRIIATMDLPGGLDGYDVFFAQNITNDAVTLGYLERKSGCLNLRRIDAASGMVTELPGIGIPFPLAAFSILNTGDTIALSRDSRVYMKDGEDWICLFEPLQGEAVASMMISDNDGVFLFTVTSDVARALLLTSGGGQFTPMDLDVSGFVKLHIAAQDNWVAMDDAYRYIVYTGGERRTIDELLTPFEGLWDTDLIIIVFSAAFVATILFSTIRTIIIKRRLHLLPKLLLIIIPLLTLGMYALVYIAQIYVTDVAERGLRESILEHAYDTMEEIDAQHFADIDWSAPFEDEYFIKLHNRLGELSGYRMMDVWDDNDKNTHNAYISYWAYRIDDDRIYTAIGGHFVTGLDVRYFEYSPENAKRRDMIRLREPVSAVFGGSESNMQWTGILFPIIANDELVGYLDAARPRMTIDEAVYTITRSIIRAGLLAFAAVIMSLILILAFSTKTLSRLKRGALAVSGGDYLVRVRTKSWDETGEIAAAFNKMAQSVETSVREITEVSNGYSRFVSDKLIELLGKDSVSAVHPGDHISLTATHILLYTDSFENLRGKAFFDAIGRFYDVVIPCIASAGGLITRYSPRGLGAVFESSPETAIRAVIAVFEILNRMENAECYAFLSYSDAMLGVTGNGGNLNMITVSQLEYESNAVGMTGKLFGSRLIVSQRAYEEMGEAAGLYNCRFLGYLRDEGEIRGLYDYFDCDTAEIKVKKDAAKQLFENGVKLYYAAEYSKARRIFVEILKQFPEDTASREFLRRSHAGLETGCEPQAIIEMR